jgi:serine/threonine-protein kinase
MRTPVLLLVLMIAVGGTVIYLLTREAAERTERGRGGGTSTPAPSEQIVSVKRTSASDFDPLGDQEEHSEEATLAVDQDPGTAWTTEGYQNDTLNKPTGEPGVGLYIDAVPGVNGRALEIQTEVPGWEMELYGATERPPADEWPSDVWTKLGGGTVEKRKQRFELDTGDKEYRYYLVWITKLPPGEDSVAINQVTLSAPKSDR